MDKVLVTGGLGFLGSHLVERLLKMGDEVTILDNCSTNTIDTSFFEDKCEIIIDSLENYNLIEKFDIIYHLASVVGPAGVLNYAGEIGPSIMRDTKKLMNYCIQNKITLIDISTSEVYGKSGFWKEDDDKRIPGSIAIRTEYGAAKLLAEISMVNKAKVEPNLKFQIIRPFNIAGPRQRPDGGFVLARFVISALTGQPITVFGNGDQVRAFTDVRDIVEGIIRIENSKYINEVWNVGNPSNRITIKDLAFEVKKTAIELYPSINESEIVFIDPKKLYGGLYEEAFDKLPNVEKLQDKIGWEPTIPLKQTLQDTLGYYKSKVDNGYNFEITYGKKLQELKA